MVKRNLGVQIDTDFMMFQLLKVLILQRHLLQSEILKRQLKSTKEMQIDIKHIRRSGEYDIVKENYDFMMHNVNFF